jgi:hypothetical protein
VAGIAVAPAVTVRPFFLAWLTLALLLLGLGRFTSAGDELGYAGFVNATDQEAIDGYFSVASDAMVVVKQGTACKAGCRRTAARESDHARARHQ